MAVMRHFGFLIACVPSIALANSAYEVVAGSDTHLLIREVYGSSDETLLGMVDCRYPGVAEIVRRINEHVGDTELQAVGGVRLHLVPVKKGVLTRLTVDLPAGALHFRVRIVPRV